MAPFRRQAQAFPATGGATTVAQVDAGLRAYMNRVYGLMAGAMVLTGAVAFTISTSPALLQLIYGSPLKWVVMLAPLGVVLLLSARVKKMQASTAQLVFWLFAALVGASISYIFVVYTGVSVARTFFITAIAFLGLSLYGYTTKRNLSGMGSFLMMGLIGLIAASIVNLFIESSALSFAVSAIGVLIFAGLTAYDTQRIKNTYLVIQHAGTGVREKSAIMGALSLYLDFLNLFLFLLHFLGMARE